MNDNANENNPAGNHRINNNKKATSKYFQYKTKITGTTPAVIIYHTQKLLFH